MTDEAHIEMRRRFEEEQLLQERGFKPVPDDGAKLWEMREGASPALSDQRPLFFYPLLQTNVPSMRSGSFASERVDEGHRRRAGELPKTEQKEEKTR